MSEKVLVKDRISSALWTVYQRGGYNKLTDCAWELMSQCERKAKSMEYRQMKGEVAEVVLDLGLRELQKTIKPSVVLKGLCIPLRSNKKSTTEMDVLFITSRRIYMFECKSYKNKPKVTGECMLGEDMDVAGQSKYHLKALHEYIGRLCNKSKGAPYKFILFEMSMEGVEDLRTPENKNRIPILNPNNFIERIIEDYSNAPTDVWDIPELVKVLEPLAKNSEKMFKIHLNRMIHKKG